MITIIGSRAFNAYFPDVLVPKDLDIIGTEEEIALFLTARADDIVSTTPRGAHKLLAKSKEFGLIECEYARGDNSSYGYHSIMNSRIVPPNWGQKKTTISGIEMVYASPDIQFSIKKAHIFYPINWEKHATQYFVLSDYNEGEDFHAEITAVRAKETEEHFGKLNTPKVNKADKADFFIDSIEKIRVFEHDDIHKLVAFERDVPAYTKMQPDQTKVACAKELWLAMTHETKCNCVLEEAFAIALERHIIPFIFIGNGKGQPDPVVALKWALMRICTTLCSGWFRQFALDNYREILARGLDTQYVDHFMDRYAAGDIIHIDTYKKFQ